MRLEDTMSSNLFLKLRPTSSHQNLDWKANCPRSATRSRPRARLPCQSSCFPQMPTTPCERACLHCLGLGAAFPWPLIQTASAVASQTVRTSRGAGAPSVHHCLDVHPHGSVSGPAGCRPQALDAGPSQSLMQIRKRQFPSRNRCRTQHFCWAPE